MQIRVEKNKINDLSEKMNKNAEEIQEIIKSLEVNTRSLASCWTGDSSLKFAQKVNEEYVKTLNEYVETLKKQSTYLKSASTLYQKLETTFAEMKIEV